MKKTLAKIYALEKAGFDCIDYLEELVASCYALSKEELASKYDEITKKINETHNYKTNQEFMDLIYKEYIKLFFNLEVE